MQKQKVTNIANIINWKYEDLVKFFNNPINIERDQYEFKQTHEIEAKELRKDFSAFANSKGGFIFFGVDNRRNICGVEESNEINTYINRALYNQYLQPPISLESWKLIKAIFKIKTKKYIYIYYIYPSIIHKPHVSDSIIYIRQNGE